MVQEKNSCPAECQCWFRWIHEEIWTRGVWPGWSDITSPYHLEGWRWAQISFFPERATQILCSSASIPAPRPTLNLPTPPLLRMAPRPVRLIVPPKPLWKRKPFIPFTVWSNWPLPLRWHLIIFLLNHPKEDQEIFRPGLEKNDCKLAAG